VVSQLPGEQGEIYRALVEHALEAMSVVDDRGSVLYENLFTERFLDHKRSERQGISFLQFVHPDDAARVGVAFEQALMDLDASPFIEFRLRGEDERWRLVEAVIRCIVHDDRRLALIHARPVSDPMYRRLDLKALAAVDPIARRTLALANDFENLFTTICLHINALAKTEPASSVSLGVRAIKKAGEVGLALTRQFLAIQHMSPAINEPIDINAIVQSLVTLLDSPQTHCVRLELSLQADRPMVFGSRAKLEYVLMNLLITMREAMPADALLSLATRNTSFAAEPREHEAPIDYVVIDVKDAAGRMAHESKLRIIDPAWSTPSGPGEEFWLIGRAIMYDVVQGLGGFIELDSEGGGITFKLFLPVHRHP
jgi:PAS domain S-box-containing protein